MNPFGLEILKEISVHKKNYPEIVQWVTNWVTACEQLKPLHYDIVLSDNYAYSDNYPKVILHFPKFKITNGIDIHEIHDMFVQCKYGQSWIEGRRSSFTLQELQSNYAHSHLARGHTLQGFESFCVGNGPINFSIMKNSQLREIITVDEILYFIAEIQTYLKWQSDRGGPYRRISGLYTDIQSTNNRLDYTRKNLVDFLRLEDIDYTNPFHLKLKEGILVPDPGINIDLKGIIKNFTNIYRLFHFRKSPIKLKIINEAELLTYFAQNKILNNKRNLTINEQNTINNRIKWVLKKSMCNRYLEPNFSINSFQELT